MYCVDSRRLEEVCYSEKNGKCTALTEFNNPCVFYKAKSIREKELYAMRMREYFKKKGRIEPWR